MVLPEIPVVDSWPAKAYKINNIKANDNPVFFIVNCLNFNEYPK
jgi:hypothetical protein